MRTKLLILVALAALVMLPTIGGLANAGPRPGLTYMGPKSVVTGNVAKFRAVYNDSSGNHISGAEVKFTLANQPTVKATTDAKGIAAVGQEVLKASGVYFLTVAVTGGPSTSLRFTVRPPVTNTSVVKVADGGGEPSVMVGPEGNIYVSGPAGPILARSTDKGKTWAIPQGLPFSSSGDTSLSSDSSGAVYLSNLGGVLQGDVYKSTNQGDGPWVHGVGPVLGSSSSQPLLVDRQWTDSYIPNGMTTDQARVYLTYHDWAPSQIWVNTSTDGGHTFGPAMDVFALSPQAQLGSFCDTVPGGIKVAPRGPHAGRVYVAWIAGDLVTNAATGCNETQLQTFHTVWVAWSDNADTQLPTWNSQLVYDGGVGHDASALFADLAIDNQGNPYVAFSMNQLNEWDTYVMASFDGGTTWNGKSDGTGNPYKVNADTGTHFFPTIAVGDPGMVDVAYLRTETIIPTLPYGKPKPGTDPNALWKVYLVQSLDLKLGSPTWTTTDIAPDYMHKGDICTLGIACVGTLGSDRSLLDFIDVAVDNDGMAHVGYTDNYNKPKITPIANQTSGPSVEAR